MFEEELHIDFNFYQNANADSESVKEGFLVREYEYSVILDDLLKHPGKGSVQHYLLLGRRGSGKSTLLRRVQVEIETNKKLAHNYIAINLAEEQANIYRLFDLLEEIVRELESRGLEPGSVEAEGDGQEYCRQLFLLIHGTMERSGKKLVLLLDNIDRIFENLGEELSVLRGDLENHSDIKIIGGSTRMTEHFWAYNKPFYEFFRTLELKPLTNEEVKRLLLNWAEKWKVDQLRNFVMKRPGQLETIRVLTDGLPRTLQFFVNILLTHTQDTGYDYLRLLMDKVTPLYQERLNYLPPAQRKIVMHLAFFWEAVGAKQLGMAARMETKLISAQLNQLMEKDVVTKVETKTKNNLYRLSERFFNLWLIFTQGSPREKRRARYLSIFLENFYEAKELVRMAKEYWDSLQDGKVNSSKAVILTKAYAQSKYISYSMRQLLVDDTLALPNMTQELKMGLPPSIADIMDQMFSAMRKDQWEKAIEVAKSIEQADGIREALQGAIYISRKEWTEAEKLLLIAVKKRNSLGYLLIAKLYESLEKFEKAEEYYRKSDNSTGLRIDLLCFYYTHNRNKSEVIERLKELVIDELIGDSRIDLQLLKAWVGDFKDLARDVWLLAQDSDNDLKHMLTHLLVHRQVELANQLFVSENPGSRLREQYLPIYYVTQLLMPGADQVSIRIPPEIKQTINEILADIRQKQEFYYPKK
jgi:hypothetical protein